MRLPLQHLSSAMLALCLPLALTVSPALASGSVPGSVTGAAPSAVTEPAAARAAARQITYRSWQGATSFRRGTLAGLRTSNAKLVMATPAGTRRFDGRTYDRGTWTGPWTDPGYSFTRLIASWSARTPGDSLVEVRVRGRDADGRMSSWDTLARWTSNDRYVKRTTQASQSDDLASVNVDTWETAGLTGYQLQVSLLRRTGTTAAPSLSTVGAVTSRLPASTSSTSAFGLGRRVVLDVPRYSQMVHEGDYPQWNGGGEAWCSPTSTSMVLGYYDALPPKRSYRWVPPKHVDPWVDYAARVTFDYGYDGTGNWPFNTAYAASRTGAAFVTRLRSLREAERFIAAGIPLVASLSFRSGELTGAPIGSTAGHLLVIVGFTKKGRVVVNDPASHDRAGVRRSYDRGQFERAWLNGSGGTVYVIRDAAHPLPRGSQTNW